MKAPGPTRSYEVLLLTFLFASAALVSVEMSQIKIGLFAGQVGGLQPGRPQGSQNQPGSGAVLVVANMVLPAAAPSRSGNISATIQLTPLVHLPLTILREGVITGRPYVLYTNESGELFERLSPGNYSITAGDSRFALDYPFVSLGGLTTRLNISVTEAYHRAAFFEFADADGSGVVNTWDRVSVLVPPGTSYALNQSMDLQFAIPFQGPFGSTATLQTNVVSGYQGSNGIWLVLTPTTPFKVLEYDSCTVINYEPGVIVSYFAS